MSNDFSFPGDASRVSHDTPKDNPGFSAAKESRDAKPEVPTSSNNDKSGLNENNDPKTNKPAKINDYRRISYAAIILAIVSAFIMVIATWIVNTTVQPDLSTMDMVQRTILQVRNAHTSTLQFSIVCAIINAVAAILAILAVLRAEVKKIAGVALFITALLPIVVNLACLALRMNILGL